MKTSSSASAKRRGKFIVIDGTDGSGKTTQVALLLKRLKQEKYPTALADFPRYGLPSAYFVEQYLNGKYGTAAEVGPYVGSLFYALDRYAAKAGLQKSLQGKNVLVSNRYVTANMGHQGAKLKERRDRREYFNWLENLEHDLMGLPRPDLTIILHVPAELAQRLVDRKGRRAYIRRKRDLHEADLKHLQAAEQTYLEMARQFDYKIIECVEKGKMLSPAEIHEKIWAAVSKQI